MYTTAQGKQRDDLGTVKKHLNNIFGKLDI
jgi:DNA-binding CsgD family transcriptional regulator